MPKKSPNSESQSVPERAGDAPPGWTSTQDTLAANADLSLLLVEGRQPPALAVSNNNSICHAFQSSAEFAKLCDPYCGDAHRRAMAAVTAVEYKCHAGLQCFTMAVKLGVERDLAVIGGRAFVKSVDYQTLMERFRVGDLQSLVSEKIFENVIFADAQRLEDLAQLLSKTARRFQSERPTHTGVAPEPAETADKPSEDDLELEIERLRGELEYRSRFADSLHHFLERISAADPEKTYLSILSNSKELLHADRASLLVFDEAANELVVKAAVGLPTELSAVSPVRMGEGVSGKVLEAGRPLMVTDIEAFGLKPAPADRLYKTKSFISYPITIGGRRIGVLNVTDKSGGGVYDEVDLSLLEIIAPQVALALERAEWQERATEFQLISITDPLTGLPNRRYLEERLTEELNRSKRYEYSMSFLMIDIDDFKAYNDNNGHQAGDLALQITAHCLKAALRSADVASRYGGEEFCILLPQTAINEAAVIADRIRQRIATTHFPHGQSQPLQRVSVSIGVSTFSSVVNTAETIIATADRALYRAKRLGKDRIEFYQDE